MTFMRHGRTVLALGLVLSSPVPAADRQPVNELESIDHATLPGDRLVVRMIFQDELEREPQVFKSHHPRLNIVMDFPATSSALGDKEKELTFRHVRGVEIAQVGSLTRVAVKLDDPVIHDIDIQGRELLLTLTPLRTVAPPADGWYFNAPP